VIALVRGKCEKFGRELLLWLRGGAVRGSGGKGVLVG